MIDSVIHIARYQKGGDVVYLLLRKDAGEHFRWYLEKGMQPTDVHGETIAETLQAARKAWEGSGFRTVICGFRYTLPERDEHGENALFCQMVQSYSTPTGVYYDEELGHNCFVDFVSQEARDVWNRLQQSAHHE